MTYEVKLDVFQGPLDLLLYLIKKNEIDIYDIPIAPITEQYLTYLEVLKSLNLDLAGEYLVLASTLIHIKSQMLLPEPAEGEAEEDDPRAELVRQLLDYQAYKQAALDLNERPLLERDVFKRGAIPEDGETAGPEDEELDVSLFALVEAFQRMVSRMAPGDLMEIEGERISLAERIAEVMDLLEQKKSITFAELLADRVGKRQLIYTFLALLELVKLRMVRAYQTEAFGAIHISLAVES